MTVGILIEKVSKQLTAISELDVQVRKLQPSQETVNNAIARLDATQGALKGIEEDLEKKGVQLVEIDGQLKAVSSAMESVAKMVPDLLEEAGMTPASMKEFGIAMNQLSERLNRPQMMMVKHHHHISKALVATFCLSLIVAALFILLVRSWSRIDLEKERDIKYRWMKVLGPQGLYVVQYIDSQYRADPVQFKKKTEEKEAQLERKTQLLEQNMRNNEELKQLQDTGKKKKRR